MKRLVVVLAVIGLLTIGVWGQETLDVYFLNVGHGDAILIDYGEWECLIDAGGNETASRDLVREFVLSDLVEGCLDLSVLTHYHDDHYFGFIDLLEELAERCQLPGAFWLSSDCCPDKCGPHWQSFHSSLGDLQTPPKTVEAGMVVSHEDLHFEVLHPSHDFTDQEQDDNECSLVALLSLGSVRFLLTGDIENLGEAALLSGLQPCGNLVLKVAHHGSATSTSLEFLCWADPELAIVSGDEDDLTPAVIENLGICGVPFLTTDENGTICVSTDGRSIRITTCEEVP